MSHQSYSDPRKKNLDHPPLRISVAFRGDGMDIFWNYTIPIRPGNVDEERLYGCDTSKFVC